MKLQYSFKTALAGLNTNKRRSMLTILGIVIGITSIILVMSLGRGAQELIVGQIKSMGAKTILIIPGRQPKGPTDFVGSLSDTLKQREYDALSRKVNAPHIIKIMPIVFGSEALAYGNETYRATVFGATYTFGSMHNVFPSEGRVFTEEEIRTFAPVAVIGSKVKSQLFGENDPIGQNIRIKGNNVRVIGVFGGKGQVSFLNFDEAAMIPYTTAQRTIFAIKYFNRLMVETDREENIPSTVQDITTTLRNLHNITDPSKDDFFLQTQAQAMATVGAITGALTAFLAAIAAISLIVGGIGIMNIMLVSVTERTREIGLRKAIGATEKDILTQFLLEAITLTGVGGLIGILLGASLSFVASLILTRALGQAWLFSLPISSILLGIGVSAGVGLLFGIYPARQASLKSPMEALRYE
ncbi:ABC transporter permease [Candidatus Uhrbacteria bacterium]|nr:ABC transporter permease [Candidatus Uhrbacteria bacterium]